MIEVGVGTLQSMIEMGIVLTPEKLYVPRDPRNGSSAESRSRFMQARACFTLMHRDELSAPKLSSPGIGRAQSHMDQFGLFSIGLDPIRSRSLGVVPVIYFYETGSGENISFEVLFRLRELRALMSCLAHIEAKAAAPGRDILDSTSLRELGYDLEDQPEVAARIAEVSESTALGAFKLLDTHRLPAWNLVDWIDILLNFFQTADSRKVPDSLAYYQQREWRLVKLYGQHIQCFALALEDSVVAPNPFPLERRIELRRRLQSIDDKFFQEDRLDTSYILYGTRDEPFFNFVDEIIVPDAAEEIVRDMLDYYDLRFRTSCLPSGSVSLERQR